MVDYLIVVLLPAIIASLIAWFIIVIGICRIGAIAVLRFINWVTP